MKRIESPDGRFAAGDPTIRKPGTLVTSTWMNALQDEICNVIEQAGLTLDDNDQTQLRAAIGNMINGAITTHKHVIADVTGLQTALNSKLNTSGGTLTGSLLINASCYVGADDNRNATYWMRDGNSNNRGVLFWDRNNDRVCVTRYDPQTGDTAGWFRLNANNTFQTSHAITAPGFNGKATSADKLHTSPTINGVSFNGTSNIITSRWGAERTLKIGNKSRTVNGSANVTWTLADIGAAAVSHNHDAAYAAKTAQHQGAATPALTPNNWNDLPAQYPYTGVVHAVVLASATNGGPEFTSSPYFYVQQFFYSHLNGATADVTQFAIPYMGQMLAWRDRYNGSWSPWKYACDSTATGRGVMLAADAAAARTAIGAGTSNLELGTTATTAKTGNWKPNINTETTGQLPYNRLALPDAFGVGSYALLIANGAVPGDTLPASQLKKSKVVHVMAYDYYYDFTFDNEPPVLAGTWRAMGRTPTQDISVRAAPALFMRIA